MKTFYLTFSLLFVCALPMWATANRVLEIDAPNEAVAGDTVSITVRASTDASDGERVGFLHTDYSIDEGKTWTQLFYSENSGVRLSRKISFEVSSVGGNSIVRSRVAFRHGVAGDVDYHGENIQWNESWQKWRWPPAKYAVIHVPKVPKVSEVSRMLSIEAPAEAVAGSTVSVTVKASTDASDGEYISFLHVGYSINEGKTWTKVFYLEASGLEVSREFSFAVKPESGKAIVRARVAYRGGDAGDVDFWGGDMQWDRWKTWHLPAAKHAIIYVRTR